MVKSTLLSQPRTWVRLPGFPGWLTALVPIIRATSLFLPLQAPGMWVCETQVHEKAVSEGIHWCSLFTTMQLLVLMNTGLSNKISSDVQRPAVFSFHHRPVLLEFPKEKTPSVSIIFGTSDGASKPFQVHIHSSPIYVGKHTHVQAKHEYTQIFLKVLFKESIYVNFSHIPRVSDRRNGPSFCAQHLRAIAPLE